MMDLDSRCLPILMYHEISKRKSNDVYCITEDTFDRHLRLIREKGLTAGSLEDYLCGRKCDLIITFDDGYSSDYEIAYPALEKSGYSATFYITTSRIEHCKSAIKRQHIKMLAENGMDIQAHGHSHDFLDGADAEYVKTEFLTPRDILGEITGQEIRHFSLPGGRFDHTTLRIARESGYRTLATSIPRLTDFSSQNLFKLNRFVINQNTSDLAFHNIITRNSGFIEKQYRRYRAKYYLKKMLGNSLYQFFWAKLMR